MSFKAIANFKNGFGRFKVGDLYTGPDAEVLLRSKLIEEIVDQAIHKIEQSEVLEELKDPFVSHREPDSDEQWIKKSKAKAAKKKTKKADLDGLR